MQKNSQPLFAQDYRVYLEDTDAGGIVYHANHLKYLERCRRDWLRVLGMTDYFYGADKEKMHHFVVSDIAIKYVQPILLDSLVTVTVSNCQPKAASLILTQEIFIAENSTQAPCSSAKVKLAYVKNSYSPDGKLQVTPARLPPQFLAMIA